MLRHPTAILALAFLAPAWTGCAPDDAPHPIKDAFAEDRPPETFGTSVAFRFSRRRGSDVRVYRLPDLEEVSWRFDMPALTTMRIVGYSSHESQIYFVTTTGELVTIDLQSGRVRTADTLVAASVLGPTNLAFSVRNDATVGVFQDRHLEIWADTLPAVPLRIWGAVDRELLGLFDGPPRSIGFISAEGLGTLIPLPDGIVMVSPWGDMVIVASDSGLTAFDASLGFASSTFPLDDPPIGIAFSPSAHAVYVTTAGGMLLVLDRFSLTQLRSRRLPAPTADIRPDPHGRFLMLKTPGVDSIWIAGTADTTLRTIGGGWSDELPAVAPDGTVLLAADDGALLAIDPTDWEVAGSVPGAAEDAWLPVTWDPRRPALQLAVDATQGVNSITNRSGRVFYAQVSSSSSKEWADDLVTNLRRAGIEARVLDPDFFYQRYRVVLGPFETRDDADDNGGKLGLPYFIFSEDTTTLSQDSTSLSR